MLKRWLVSRAAYRTMDQSMTLDLAFDLEGQFPGQVTGCRILSRNYVSMCTKMVQSNSQPPCAAYTAMTLDLAFDLQGPMPVNILHGLDSNCTWTDLDLPHYCPVPTPVWLGRRWAGPSTAHIRGLAHLPACLCPIWHAQEIN